MTRWHEMTAYVVVAGPSGINRIIRADGAALGATPLPPERLFPAPPPPPPTVRRDWRQFVAHVQHKAQPKAPRMPVGNEPEDAPPTGEELRQRREALKIGQRTLAALARVSRGVLSDTESGRRRSLVIRAAIDTALCELEAAK